jgi:hypothetical protein
MALPFSGTLTQRLAAEEPALILLYGVEHRSHKKRPLHVVAGLDLKCETNVSVTSRHHTAHNGGK